MPITDPPNRSGAARDEWRSRMYRLQDLTDRRLRRASWGTPIAGAALAGAGGVLLAQGMTTGKTLATVVGLTTVVTAMIGTAGAMAMAALVRGALEESSRVSAVLDMDHALAAGPHDDAVTCAALWYCAARVVDVPGQDPDRDR